MNQYCNINYTRQSIEAILFKIKESVRLNKIKLSLGEKREKNKLFIREYNINTKERNNFILELEVEDFCHSIKNIHPDFEKNDLYVFAPIKKIFKNNKYHNVQIYMKFNIITKGEDTNTILISLTFVKKK